MKLLVILAMVLFLAPSAGAVTFDDGGVHVIDAANSYPFDGVIVDDGPGGEATTLEMVQGGQIGTEGIAGGLSSLGSSVVNISGGAAWGDILASENSVFSISGGTIEGSAILRIQLDAVAKMSGGTVEPSVWVFDNGFFELVGGTIVGESFGGLIVSGRAKISGGTLREKLIANSPPSEITVSGGLIEGTGGISLTAAGYVKITGGTFIGDFEIVGNSGVVEMYGGSLGGSLSALGNSAMTFAGSDFNFPLGPISASSGALTGVLGDGTPVDVPFIRASTATITLVPGPFTTAPAALNTNAATDSGSDIFPQIATDGGNNWVAIWRSTEDLGATIGTDHDILTTLSSDNGQTWTDPAALNSTANGDSSSDSHPSLATDGAGNWIAVWTSTDDLTNTVGVDQDIHFARSVDNGATWTDAAALNTNAPDDTGVDRLPFVTSDGSVFVAVWESDDGALGPDLDIRVSRSANGGVTWSPAVALNTDASGDSANDVHVRVAADGAGKWVAVWESDDSTLGGDGDILTAQSSDGGVIWSDPAPIDTNAATDAGTDAYPYIRSDGAGTWVAAWESDDTPGGTDRDILFARSTDDGANWTPTAPLNTNSAIDSGDDANPSITTDNVGNWTVVWDSGDDLEGEVDTDFDILVARSTDAGVTWTDPSALNKNSETDIGGDYNPRIATNATGLSVAVWHSDEDLDETADTDWDVFFAVIAAIDGDSDGDGIPDHSDNCPVDSNFDQQDTDLDQIGDVCDPLPNDPCNFIGALDRSTANLAAFQDNNCEDWAGVAQPGDNLQSAVLTKADLSLANLSGALLFNATLLGASLDNANLVNANLTSANLDSATLTNADLSFSNLTGAILTSADMSIADLSSSTLAGAMYDESTLFPSGNTYDTPPWGLDGDETPWDAGMVPVPEPSGGALLVCGVLGIAALTRCRRVRS